MEQALQTPCLKENISILIFSISEFFLLVVPRIHKKHANSYLGKI